MMRIISPAIKEPENKRKRAPPIPSPVKQNQKLGLEEQ